MFIFCTKSLKGAELISEVLGVQRGFACNPPPGTHRTDIIQAVQLGDRDRLVRFCEVRRLLSLLGA